MSSTASRASLFGHQCRIARLGGGARGNLSGVPAWHRWQALIGVAVVAGCVAHPVGPARTFDKFEGKAVTTVESALSAVETVRLVAVTASKQNAFGPFVGIAVSEQEEAVAGVQNTFGSIQPPNARADRLRGEVDQLLSDALDHVIDVRIAARRGRLRTLIDVAAPLEDDAAALRQFVKEHRS
jgi:hypothetical protein